MELFKCLFKLLLIPGKVGGNGVVEKDQLIVQYFNLWAGQSYKTSINTVNREADQGALRCCTPQLDTVLSLQESCFHRDRGFHTHQRSTASQATAFGD